jgi:hypothetical protein
MVNSTEHFIHLSTISQLELVNVNAGMVSFRGREAIRLVEPEGDPGNGQSLAILSDSAFTDGVVETEVAGSPRPDAPEFARGFVGVAFHVQPRASRFEAFFLRPTNSRANDQLRRNHSTQYMSHPDHPWFRLREEAPGLYESYVDLAPGEWTRIKIEVAGTRALLYVNGTEQPCLVVNDLKLGRLGGQIALWIGAGTEAYFSTEVRLDGAAV